MSGQDQTQQERVDAGASDAPLQFHCPHCQMALEIPASLAGVKGPCPGCREEIEAPAPAAGEPKKIAIKPRLPKPAKNPAPPIAPPAAPVPNVVPPPISEPVAEAVAPPVNPPVPGPPVANPPVPVQPPIPPAPEQQDVLPERRRRRVRVNSDEDRKQGRSRRGMTIVPETGTSEKYEDRKEFVAVLKVLGAILVTALIVFGVVKISRERFLRDDFETREAGS